MQCTRGTALSLTFSQLVAMVAVSCYYTDKRPLFSYTTSLSHVDAMRVAEQSNVTFWFENDGSPRSVNPYLQPRVLSPTPLHNGLNPARSFLNLMLVNAFLLFVAGSTCALVYSFLTVRVVESGQVTCSAAYGDHGVAECLGWEVLFWFYVWLQHGIVLTVMASPVDAVYAVFESFGVVVLIGTFCCVSANMTSDNPSRRIEAPILILLCLCYVVFISHSKVIVSRHFTYLTWFVYLFFDGLLVMGHTWESPVVCETVVNCRWAYVVMCSWMNVVLYVAY